MKKLFALVLSLSLCLTMVACGSSNNNTADDAGNHAAGNTEAEEAPDLTRYFEDFMASLGENAPAMMEISGEIVDGYYPGLSDYAAKQSVLQGAAISAVAYEFALLELENVDDVDAVAAILQARIDSQVDGGALYPATVEAWEKAKVITKGNVVALIVAGEQQADAEAAFEALFE